MAGTLTPESFGLELEAESWLLALWRRLTVIRPVVIRFVPVPYVVVRAFKAAEIQRTYFAQKTTIILVNESKQFENLLIRLVNFRMVLRNDRAGSDTRYRFPILSVNFGGIGTGIGRKTDTEPILRDSAKGATRANLFSMNGEFPQKFGGFACGVRYT